MKASYFPSRRWPEREKPWRSSDPGRPGFAAAQQLARAGHSVTLEKADRIGGLLRYGIPDFKMEKWVIDRRLEQLKAEGVEFKTGVTVGTDITGEQLRAVRCGGPHHGSRAGA